MTTNNNKSMITIENYLDNCLRAAVLGANDGIISISKFVIGFAGASSTREPIVLATVAGLVAGALSMAAGEYVSASSQTGSIQLHPIPTLQKINLQKKPTHSTAQNTLSFFVQPYKPIAE